jgi:predicted aldo/keto reductase-like oxidoreductase
VADRWRREGRIRHIGFSTHGPTPLILEAVATGAFDYVNLHYYYVLQDNHPVLAAAQQQDMGVFIISPTDKGGRLQTPSEKLRRLCAPLSPMVFNDLWCLAHPQIHTLSLGAQRPSDFDEHLTVLPLLAAGAVEARLAPIVARLEHAYAEALGADFARDWARGLPPWQQLPGKINVRRILWLDNLARAYDLLDFAQERYAAMSPDDHWVPGAQAADFRDRELLAALPDSPFRAEMPQRLREAHTRLYNPDVEPGP